MAVDMGLKAEYWNVYYVQLSSWVMQEELYMNNKYLGINIKALMSAFIVFIDVSS